MRFEKGHIPANKNGGKKMDASKFEEYFMKYLHGEINQKVFAKGVGLSEPTLHKHLKELLGDGIIRGVFFTDGKPMMIGINGFIRGEEQETKQEIKQEIKQEVIYPILE